MATPATLEENRRALSLVIRILPADEESAPSLAERLRFIPYVIIPWLLLYALTAKLASQGISFGMPFEDRLPILSWTAPIYQSIYVVIALAPWWVRTRRDLRRLMISCWLAMAVVFPFYWLVPSSAPRRALLGHGWIASLLGVERTAFPPIAAFPSFHVLWAIFLGRAFRPRWMGWTYAALIAVACITTGQHYIADVVCSAMLAPAFLEPERAWKLTAFFSNVSHEFRTPLTLMMGPLEDAMAQSGVLPALVRENLELAHRNSLRLLKLVNALLDFSRIEARRNQASFEPTDLALLTAELASIFRSAIERAGMRLVIDCPSLPEEVYVDREMWEKIVLNLLSNAFKFTFEGEIEISLRPKASSSSVVELRVRDTGTGIPAGEISRVFERFHRIEGARGRSYEGSGIGLALVQELVKLHGGSVRVESELGHGSCFIVEIPRGKGHLPAERIQAPKTQSSTALSAEAYVGEAERWSPNRFGAVVDVPVAPIGPKTPSVGEIACAAESAGEKKLVLVADDNANMRDYLSHLLEQEYRVHAVCDGLQTIEAARQLQPALVLTDVMMPGMDGFGVLRAIRSDPSLNMTPVILVSARAGEESRVEGLEAGADDYLEKMVSETVHRLKSRFRKTGFRGLALDSEFWRPRTPCTDPVSARPCFRLP